MFQIDARFDYVNALRVERALLRAGWSDLLRVHVGEDLVYEDRTGIANDLEPTLNFVRETWLHRRTTYDLAVGKPVGPLDLVVLLTVKPLGIRVRFSALDRQVEPRPDESEPDFGDRVRSLLAQDWHRLVLGEVTEAWENLRQATHTEGWLLRHAEGPWLALRTPDADLWASSLHARYGHAPSRLMDATLLQVLDEDGVLEGADIRVVTPDDTVPFERGGEAWS